MKLLHYANGAFYLLVGIIVPVFWIITLFKGGFSELSTAPLSSYFHLFSEAILAFFCILTALGMFKGRNGVKRLYFITAGLLICSSFNAAFYYIYGQAEDQLVSSVLFLVFFLALALAMLSYKPYGPKKMKYEYPRLKNRNITLFTYGILLYALLNITGVMLEQDNKYTGISVILIFSVILITLISWSMVRTAAEEDAKWGDMKKYTNQENTEKRKMINTDNS